MTARAGYSNRVEPGYNEVGTAARAEPAPEQTSKPGFLLHMVQPSWTCPSHIHVLPPTLQMQLPCNGLQRRNVMP